MWRFSRPINVVQTEEYAIQQHYDKQCRALYTNIQLEVIFQKAICKVSKHVYRKLPNKYRIRSEIETEIKISTKRAYIEREKFARVYLRENRFYFTKVVMKYILFAEKEKREF